MRVKTKDGFHLHAQAVGILSITKGLTSKLLVVKYLR